MAPPHEPFATVAVPVDDGEVSLPHMTVTLGGMTIEAEVPWVAKSAVSPNWTTRTAGDWAQRLRPDETESV